MPEKVKEHVKRDIIGLLVVLKVEGIPYEGFKNEKSGKEVKPGESKEAIQLKLGQYSIQPSPLQLLGVINLQHDKSFMEELNKRAKVQADQIRQFIPK